MFDRFVGLSLKGLKDSNNCFQNVLIGGEAFPLRTNLVEPYVNSNLDIQIFITNYLISRARRITENTFGILIAKFRIGRPILATDNFCANSKACVALYNLLMADRKSNWY